MKNMCEPHFSSTHSSEPGLLKAAPAMLWYAAQAFLLSSLRPCRLDGVIAFTGSVHARQAQSVWQGSDASPQTSGFGTAELCAVCVCFTCGTDQPAGWFRPLIHYLHLLWPYHLERLLKRYSSRSHASTPVAVFHPETQSFQAPRLMVQICSLGQRERVKNAPLCQKPWWEVPLSKTLRTLQLLFDLKRSGSGTGSHGTKVLSGEQLCVSVWAPSIQGP